MGYGNHKIPLVSAGRLQEVGGHPESAAWGSPRPGEQAGPRGACDGA